MKFNKGDTVYINTTWSVSKKATIKECIENEQTTGKNVYIVNIQYGTLGVIEDCVFATEEEAKKSHQDKYNKQVEKYCEEIKTLEDLIRFSLTHTFYGEEYTNYEAINAYKIKAKEFGFNLDDIE